MLVSVTAIPVSATPTLEQKLLSVQPVLLENIQFLQNQIVWIAAQAITGQPMVAPSARMVRMFQYLHLSIAFHAMQVTIRSLGPLAAQYACQDSISRWFRTAPVPCAVLARSRLAQGRRYACLAVQVFTQLDPD